MKPKLCLSNRLLHTLSTASRFFEEDANGRAVETVISADLVVEVALVVGGDKFRSVGLNDKGWRSNGNLLSVVKTQISAAHAWWTVLFEDAFKDAI